MINDSSIMTVESDIRNKNMKSPKESTLNFIRQFARTYVVLEGTGFNRLSIN